MKTILHIDMDAFFASVEQKRNPLLKDKPVIVGADPKNGLGRGVVAACSYQAREYGVHSAMPISEAYRRCPQAIFIRPQMDEYSKASKDVFKIVNSFTPHLEKLSIDEAFLDVSSSVHFFGSAKAMAQEIKSDVLQKTGLVASIGIGPNKMVAKIASDMGKPDGLFEVTHDQVEEFLFPLSINKIWGVGKKTGRTLNHLGIFTIGELAHYPLRELQEHLGDYGLKLHRLSQGVDDRKVEEKNNVKSISHEHTFDEDTQNIESIKQVMGEICQNLSIKLRKKRLKSKSISIKIRLKSFKTFNRSITLGEEVNHFEDIFQASWDLFMSFYKLGMIFRLIGVRVSGFESPYVAASLFTNPVREKSEQIHKAVDQITDKFGSGAIFRGISYRKT